MLAPNVSVSGAAAVALAFACGAFVDRMRVERWRCPEPAEAQVAAPALVPEGGEYGHELTPAFEALRERERVDEIRDLRPGEQLVLWYPGREEWDRRIRASVFVSDGAGWRHAGDVDGLERTTVVTITPDGIAIIESDYTGGGAWSPSQVHAIAVADGRLAVVASDVVPTIEYDRDDPHPEIRLRRWSDIDPYPFGERYRVTRWEVHLTAAGLAATETSLVPWWDTLVAFCTGAHPELADDSVLARNVSCIGYGNSTKLRWRSRREVIATLDLRMLCDDADHDEPYEDGVGDGQLVLRLRRGGWRVAAVHGCE